jgi:cellulose synthase/poly-beta-1,6-N-acetylglucosamine synthase-like glycosyltransferase
MYIELALLYVITYFGLFTAIFFLLTLMENRKRVFRNPLTKYPSVTVVVPAFNEEHTIGRTIESLLDLDYPKEKIEIIVVDDGSNDDTLRVARMYESKQVKVFSKPNGGKGSALNFALAKAKGEFIGALDADSFVHRDSLKKIMSHFTENDIVAVTPSLKVYGPKTVLQKIQYIEYLMGVFLRKIFAFMDSIHVTPGPFTIFRKSFFDKYGGYDEDNITEDIEVALRIQTHNLKIENAIDASVYTVAPSKFKELMNQRVRWYCGFMQNTYHYKHLFSPKYGTLSMFVLPSALISVILVVVAFFYSIFTLASNSYTNIKNLIAINFDFVRMMTFRMDPFFTDYGTILFFSAISLVIGVVIILLAKNLSKEQDVKIKYFYIFYLLFYWMLYGFWWIVAFYHFITNKKVSWRHKSEA